MGGSSWAFKAGKPTGFLFAEAAGEEMRSMSAGGSERRWGEDGGERRRANR